MPRGAELEPDERYLTIKNWDRFQHYGDRVPPWIKLYNSLLENVEFASLPDHQKGQLVGIWLLASRLGGRIPNNPQFVAGKINSTEKVDLDSLVRSGFLVSPTPPSLEENKSKNKSKRALARGSTPTLAREVPEYIDLEVWYAFKEMRRVIHRSLTKYGERRILNKLEVLKEQGEDPNEVLNQSIEKSWNGVFPVKKGLNGNGKKSDEQKRAEVERIIFRDFEDEPHVEPLRVGRDDSGAIREPHQVGGMRARSGDEDI